MIFFLLNAFRVEEKKKSSKVPKVIADLKVAPDIGFAELPIIIVKATYNNTLVYLTDHNGINLCLFTSVFN